MFERFTDRARRAVVLAQEEAQALDHEYIGTEHLLLALIHEGEGIAAQALRACGVSLEAARGAVTVTVGRGQRQAFGIGYLPFTARTKNVLERARREALRLDCRYVGTEHLLLALLDDPHGMGSLSLHKLGVDLDTLREQVLARSHVVRNPPRSQASPPQGLPVKELPKVHIALVDIPDAADPESVALTGAHAALELLLAVPLEQRQAVVLERVSIVRATGTHTRRGGLALTDRVATSVDTDRFGHAVMVSARIETAKEKPE